MEDVCGACIAWRPEAPEARSSMAAAGGAAPDAAPDADARADLVQIGSCRLRPELGRVPASLAKCALYRARGQPDRPAPTAARRSRTSRTARPSGPTARRARASSPTPRGASIVPPVPAPDRPLAAPLGTAAVDSELRRVAFQLHQAELGPGRDLKGRFEGGTVEVRDRDGKVDRFPIEVLFRRLVRLRNALDQLESEVDSHPKLQVEAEELVGLVRKVHGSLTTFNVLFDAPIDQFSGKS